MDKIFVADGAGYIGSHLAKNLFKNGYQVVVFDNKNRLELAQSSPNRL